MPRLPIRRGPGEPGGWDPLAEFNRLAQEMASTLEHWRSLLPIGGDFTVPAADVEETADAYLVEVDLPGVQKGDVTVELTGDRLTVRAERKERERVGVLRRRTRTTGIYQYEITLPGEVDAERAEATLADGVLTLRLPKAGGATGRRIPIT